MLKKTFYIVFKPTKQFILIVLLLHSFYLTAQLQNNLLYKFNELNVSNGLNSNYITNICQDSNNFIWIGSSNGLNRFDGINIKAYTHNPSNVSSIPKGAILFLFVDFKGTLWIITNSGICKYNPNFDNFTSFTSKNIDFSKNIFKVNYIYQDDTSCFWISSPYGLSKYVYETNSFISYKYSFNYNKTLKEKEAFSILQADSNCLWLGNLNFGLLLFNKNKGTYTKINQKNITNNNTTLAVFKTHKGLDSCLWLSIYEKRPIKYNYITKKYITIDNKIFDNKAITSFSNINKTELWIGTHLGLISYNYNTKKYIPIAVSIDNKTSKLLDINCIVNDKQGNIWVGTSNSGVYYYSPYENIFVNNFTEININPNDAIRSVKSILENSDNSLWLGTDYGLIKINNEGKIISTFASKNTNKNNCLSGGGVSSLYVDAKNNFWVGTWGSSIYKFDTNNNKFYNKYCGEINENNPNCAGDACILAIAEDNSNNLWLATVKNGIDKFNLTTNKFIHFKLPADFFKCLLFDKKRNVLWAGSDNGIWKVNLANNAIIKVTSTDLNSELLLSTQIECMFFDKYNNLIIGSSNGVVNYSPEKNKFEYSDFNNIIASKIITCGVFDNDSNLWLGTGKGISKVMFKTNTCINYDITSNVCPYAYCCYKLKNGNILFGSTCGLVYINPKNTISNNYKSTVYLTDFKIFNKTVNYKNSTIFNKPIHLTKSIAIKYNQSVISIQYAAICFIQPNQIQFAYKLDGLENDWNYVGSKKEANYNNLYPGKYTFRVKATNNNGLWNNLDTSIEIIVIAPFWKTWWFKTLLFLAVILSGGLIFWIKIYKTEQRNIELEKKVNERTLCLLEAIQKLETHEEEIKAQNEELRVHRENLEDLVQKRTFDLEIAKVKAEESEKLKTSFLLNLSHEIRTPMNAIIGFNNLLHDSETNENQRKSYIQQINENSHCLLSLIENLVLFSQLESNLITPRICKFNLGATIKQICIQYEQNYERITKNIELKIVENNTIIELKTDRDLFEIMLVQLLNNAIKYTEEGIVSVNYFMLKASELEDKYNIFNISNVNEFIVVSISDTGIGIPSEKLSFIFNKFTKIENTNKLYRGVGVGLGIVKKISDLLDANVWVQSDLNIGSRFFVAFPYNNE